jgi:hypothetical protein
MCSIKSHFPRTKPPFSRKCKSALIKKFLVHCQSLHIYIFVLITFFPKLLPILAIVGDSLIEPFWPEGTGIGQGFLRYLILYITD